MTATVGTGFTNPLVERRYRQYIEDNHGDVSDLPHLLEVIFNAGMRQGATAMVVVSDVVPTITRAQGRVMDLNQRLEELRALFESLEED